jgi:hypothetical protein
VRESKLRVVNGLSRPGEAVLVEIVKFSNYASDVKLKARVLTRKPQLFWPNVVLMIGSWNGQDPRPAVLKR